MIFYDGPDSMSTPARGTPPVGATGNAVSMGCHLHFEVREPCVPIDPEPLLAAWDRWS